MKHMEISNRSRMLINSNYLLSNDAPIVHDGKCNSGPSRSPLRTPMLRRVKMSIIQTKYNLIVVRYI